MTPEQKQWIAALRSGDYEQGTGYLENDGKFCCLGVACHLFIQDLRSAPDFGPAAYDEEPGTAPPILVKMLHLHSDIGAIEGSGDCLTEMNDLGMTFTEIADFIEANPDKVFRNVS